MKSSTANKAKYCAARGTKYLLPNRLTSYMLLSVLHTNVLWLTSVCWSIWSRSACLIYSDLMTFCSSHYEKKILDLRDYFDKYDQTLNLDIELNHFINVSCSLFVADNKLEDRLTKTISLRVFLIFALFLVTWTNFVLTFNCIIMPSLILAFPKTGCTSPNPSWP